MSAAPGERRGFRLRWWMWLAAALLIVASLALGLRVQGFRAFARVQADIAAAGLPTDPVQLVAGYPSVDADRQRRWLAIERRVRAWPDLNAGSHLTYTPAEQAPDPRAEANAVAFLAAGAADADAIAALLDEGPVLVSFAGFVTRDEHTLRTGSFDQIWGPDSVPNLLSTRWLAMHAALRALRETDPAPGLHRLRQLETALSTPGCLIDEMIGIAITTIADATRLRLAVRGRLPANEMHAWLSRSDHWRSRMAAAWTGERSIMWPLTVRQGLAGSGLMGGGSPSAWEWVHGVWGGARWWCFVGWECAVGASQQANIELGLRGQTPITEVDIPLGLSPVLAGIVIPNLQESLVTSVESAYGSRLRRVLAAIAMAYRQGTPVPPDASGLDPALAPLLAAGATADEPAIVYERLGPSRLRVGLDPTATRPPLVPASRWTADYGTRIGQPASTKPWEDRGRWSLEIDLDAILVPPPPPKPRATKPPASSPQPPASP